MKLTINTAGVTIKKEGECFLIGSHERKERLSSKKVEQIILTTAATISTDAIKLAMENNIDIVFLEAGGMPFARVWHSKLGSIATIRRKQLTLTENQQGITLVKEWIGQKIDHQIQHLNKLSYNRSEDKKKLIKEGIGEVKKSKEMLLDIEGKNIEDIRYQIEGYEGIAGRIYFGVLSELIPAQYTFKGRSRNPAKDFFNCMLNYAYGILYARVEKHCIIAGLDPYIGIMHTDNYNKKSLVFDLIEMYRGYMNEIVFSLFSTKQVKKSMFDEVPNGYYLNKEGKEKLIAAVHERFSEAIKYKGKNIEIENIIGYDCHSIANWILREVE